MLCWVNRNENILSKEFSTLHLITRYFNLRKSKKKNRIIWQHKNMSVLAVTKQTTYRNQPVFTEKKSRGCKCSFFLFHTVQDMVMSSGKRPSGTIANTSTLITVQCMQTEISTWHNWLIKDVAHNPIRGINYKIGQRQIHTIRLRQRETSPPSYVNRWEPRNRGRHR